MALSEHFKSTGDNMAGEENSPLILLFSPRERKRSILAAGLLQSNYCIVEANTPYIAGVKANQYLPDLIIADISKENAKDFLFLSRLEQSKRTMSIPVLLSITNEIKTALDIIHEETKNVQSGETRIRTIQYPFDFSDLLKKIEEILKDYKKKHRKKSTITMSGKTQIVSERLYDFQMSVQKKLTMIENTVEKQWAFPFTIVRSLEIIGSENSCCNELAKCIESDLAAASAILSIANRVNYAKSYGRISNVNEAIIRIGFNQTRNILASLCLIDVSSEVNLEYGFRRVEFWLHSLATAIIAEMLCAKLGFNRPELAFIAGLIHDIGKIPLDNNFPDVFTKLLDRTTNKIALFNDIELQQIGISHSDIGHHFTTKWNFPSLVTLPILNHHFPDRILTSNIANDRVIQEAVFTANILAKAMSMGHSCDEVLSLIREEILKELHIPNGPSVQFFDKVFGSLWRYYDLLKLSEKEVTLVPPMNSARDIEIIQIKGEHYQFHPIILGLKNMGFTIKTFPQLPEKIDAKNGIVIYIPDKDVPLDITINEEDTIVDENNIPVLRIFLLDGIEMKDIKKDLTNSNIIILNSRRVDLRFLLQVIEDFYYSTTIKM